jgi:hypothetical protein
MKNKQKISISNAQQDGTGNDTTKKKFNVAADGKDFAFSTLDRAIIFVLGYQACAEANKPKGGEKSWEIEFKISETFNDPRSIAFYMLASGISDLNDIACE